MKNLTVTVLLLGLGAAGAQAGLRGALIVAADGTFLGTCEGRYATLSVANPYGRHGSEYSPHSVFNRHSLYGGEHGLNSAFNPNTVSAPYLLTADRALLATLTASSYRPTPQFLSALRASGAGRVSVNRNLIGAVHPETLRQVCAGF